MGGARFLGMDCGVPQSKEQDAFNLVIYWLLGGGIFTFGLAMLFLPTQSLAIPSVAYILVLVILGWRYFKMEVKDGKI